MKEGDNINLILIYFNTEESWVMIRIVEFQSSDTLQIEIILEKSVGGQVEKLCILWYFSVTNLKYMRSFYELFPRNLLKL